MNPEIISLARNFRLSSVSSGIFVPTDDMKGEECLLAMLKAEAALRAENALKERLRQARLPTFKSFEDFDTDFQKGITRTQLDTLAKLEWIDDLYNLILIGPPGTGKTHIALAIGNKAAREGYKVAFTTMDGLVHILKTHEISQKSLQRLNWFRKCDLLIIDELGYLPVSRIEANLFFSLISELYESASIIVTSNKGFDGWADLLGDAVLATALLDRLTHRCQVLTLSDDSYRLKNRKQIWQ